MDIKDFHLERAVFEYRYSPSYLLWDHAGALWTDATSKWPQLKAIRTEPNITNFKINDAFEVGVTSDKTTVTGYDPKADLVDFNEKVVYFFEATTRHLGITHFTRVGCRLIYFRSYPTEKAASDSMLATKVLPLPEGPHFGIDGAFNLPEYAVRWEAKTAGVTIRLRTEGRKTDFEPPLGVQELKPVHEEKFGIVLDLDYFTKGTVTTGQFRPQDWISNVLHMFRRDSRKFLGA